MIILFDLDSTLVSVEWCDILAEWKWIGAEISHITKQTMDGNMDFNTAFPKKLEMIAPSIDDLDKLWQHLTKYINKDRLIIINNFLNKWYKVWILSQWYTRSSLIVAEKIGIPSDWIFAINFEHNSNGWFKSLDMSQDLMYHNGKQRVINNLRKENPNKKIIFIWDSVGDMEAWNSADLFIGYTGIVKRNKVVEQCQKIANTPNEVLSIINNFNS